MIRRAAPALAGAALCTATGTAGLAQQPVQPVQPMFGGWGPSLGALESAAACEAPRGWTDLLYDPIAGNAALDVACRAAPADGERRWRRWLTLGRERIDLAARLGGFAEAGDADGFEVATLRPGLDDSRPAGSYDLFARLRGRDGSLPLSYGVDLQRQAEAGADGDGAAHEALSAMAAWDFTGAYRLDGMLKRTRDPDGPESALLSSGFGLRGPLLSLGGTRLSGNLRGTLGQRREPGAAEQLGRSLRLILDSRFAGGRSARLSGGIEELWPDGSAAPTWRSRLGLGLGYDFSLWGWKAHAAPGLETLRLSAEAKAASALRLDLTFIRREHEIGFGQSLQRDADLLASTAGFSNETRLNYRYSWNRFSLGLEWSHADPYTAGIDEDSRWQVRAVWRVLLDAE